MTADDTPTPNVLPGGDGREPTSVTFWHDRADYRIYMVTPGEPWSTYVLDQIRPEEMDERARLVAVALLKYTLKRLESADV